MQAPLLTCYVASFQEKVGHVILRDVNAVQNASYIKIKYLKQAKQKEKQRSKKAEKQRNRKRTKAKQQKGKEAGKAEKQRSRKSRKSRKAEKQEKQEKQRSRNPKIIPKPDPKKNPKIISPPFNWDHLMMSHWVWCLTPFLGQTHEHHNPFAL